MTTREAVMALLMADLASGKSTVRSLGMIYAMAIACYSHGDSDWYGEINRAIMDAKGWHGVQVRRLDPIKKIGWDLNKAIAQKEAA